MLDDRKSAILRAIVEEYIGTGHPVGSAAVTRAARLSVSSATVRNEMMVLEAQGYITQPHTSAGRVPTDAGYRYYVDYLATPLHLKGPDRAEVTAFFAQAHRELEQLLAASSRLLSHLTAYAAVVAAPQIDHTRIREVHLTGLGTDTALVLVILSTGAIDKFTVEGFTASEDDLSAASRALTDATRGRLVSEVPRAVSSTGRDAADAAAAAVLRELEKAREGMQHPFYLDGASNLAAGVAELSEVQHVLSALERQVSLVSILSEAVAGSEVVVRIGSENSVAEMREWSVVTAPYVAGDGPIGAVGVVGPTRMNYARAISAVEAVSAGLGAALGSLAAE